MLRTGTTSTRSSVRLRSGAIGVTIAALALVSPVRAAAPELGKLQPLQSGMWEVRDRETKATSRICLRSGTELIRLRHRSNGPCKSYLIEDGPSRVAVQYSCSKSGYGLTTIRRESSTLVQLTSEGMSNGQPFSFSVEARRTGGC
ncbi:hypothetical protein MKP08_02945 [Erythrobacter sp. LQ02-29]|uniref:hypothetical protein n=1 Tax=Erythrobacter sp. LQ02-29 TaxID=2920384 RepID=UPI001F4E1481|nr:hypothetical protein [Erythrobacter sp. LQ02-29]MCP9221704.1 hypothetical protein [Erythrobacter sp. LQ02-29]